MSSSFNLQVIEDLATLADGISETRKMLLHHNLAIVELLIAKGICTPEEYQLALDRTVGAVDQIWTEKIDEACKAARDEDAEQQHRVLSVLSRVDGLSTADDLDSEE